MTRQKKDRSTKHSSSNAGNSFILFQILLLLKLCAKACCERRLKFSEDVTQTEISIVLDRMSLLKRFLSFFGGQCSP